jgi:lipopolysaccharide transport system ATP-binding protein
MSDLAIRVVDLGKKYHIGGKKERYKTLRASIVDSVSSPVRRVGRIMRGEDLSSGDRSQTFWALRDVSFDVKHGDVLGIVGRNGAGKSTLLKILSRITEPTEGYADIYGRVGSLLEVGTGFHMELTGRENVYLNGAILGMTRAEIDRKFDEIVAFAEVEKFIDTPVKHYSSGMGLRLGFAVAAHLEPEILIVDEVLAVGDANFQNKCIGKMGEVAGQGRTVLFVSHNIAAVSSLCNKGILLKNGRMELAGDVNTVVQAYQASVDSVSSIPLDQREDRSGSSAVRFSSLNFVGSGTGGETTDLVSGQAATATIEVRTKNGQPVNNAAIDMRIVDLYGNFLFTLSTRYQSLSFNELHDGAKIEVRVDSLPLIPGIYRVDLWCAVAGQESDYIREAGQFVVTEGDFFGTGKLPNRRKNGPILVRHVWKVDGNAKP